MHGKHQLHVKHSAARRKNIRNYSCLKIQLLPEHNVTISCLKLSPALESNQCHQCQLTDFDNTCFPSPEVSMLTIVFSFGSSHSL